MWQNYSLKFKLVEECLLKINICQNWCLSNGIWANVSASNEHPRVCRNDSGILHG